MRDAIAADIMEPHLPIGKRGIPVVGRADSASKMENWPNQLMASPNPFGIPFGIMSQTKPSTCAARDLWARPCYPCRNLS